MSLQPTDPDPTDLDDAVLHAILAKVESDEWVARRMAAALGPYLPRFEQADHRSGWLDFEGAVAYLGMKRGTLYKHTSARTVPFHQDGPGCKLWFLRSELDAWRLGGGQRVASRALGM
jgi:predicted DNA-binding transcriptional regulator AlpA